MKDENWILREEKDGPDLNYIKTHIHKYSKKGSSDNLDILVISSADAANVIPITPEGEVILVEQYRFGTQMTTLEIPGGLINPDELPLDGIKRELSEETGYTSKHWKSIGKLPFNPVYHKNFIHHFIAENVILTDQTNFDFGEEITLKKLPLPQVIHQVKQGQLAHPHTISAFMLAYDYLIGQIP